MPLMFFSFSLSHIRALVLCISVCATSACLVAFNNRAGLSVANRPVRHHQGEIRLAIASRSPVDEGGAARGILGALGLIDKFCCLEIHRGSKAVHFQVGTALSSVRVCASANGRVFPVCGLSFD